MTAIPAAVVRGTALPFLRSFLILPVLAVQAALSLRLIWVNTAFQDEGLYLWAGHLEIAHWLHGAPVPAFPAYFSGAPVLYPPLGALADSLGGLAAARTLSLLMMLTATVLLWRTAAMLFGGWPALCAATLWVTLGPTQHLGAFATFDAMSLCLMAGAACCAVRAGAFQQAPGWTLGAAATLILSDLTAYSSLIFDPFVIALAVLTAWQRSGGQAARARLTSLLAYLITAFAILVRMGGPRYVQGLTHTVLDRAGGTAAVPAVLRQAWSWSGLIVILACAAVIAGLITERGPQRPAIPAILAILLAAVLVVPAEQARIHTLTSLDKHLAVGTWFAAIGAGYAMNWVFRRLWHPVLRGPACAVCLVALYFPVTAGIAQASALNSWPDAAAFVTWLRPIADKGHGPMLIETPPIAEYYLLAGRQWQRWSSTYNIMLPSGRSVEHSGKIGYPGDPQAYRKLIADGFFSVIALDHGKANILDRALVGYIARNHAYRAEAVIPYGRSGYSVWVTAKAGE